MHYNASTIGSQIMSASATSAKCMSIRRNNFVKEFVLGQEPWKWKLVWPITYKNMNKTLLDIQQLYVSFWKTIGMAIFVTLFLASISRCLQVTFILAHYRLAVINLVEHSFKKSYLMVVGRECQQEWPIGMSMGEDVALVRGHEDFGYFVVEVF